MATAVVGLNGLDMSQLDISILLESTVVSQTSTRYVLDYFGEGMTFTGFGFTYDAFGYPIGGTVTGLQVTYFGQVIYQISGFSTPVTSWVVWAQNGDTLGAMRAVFAGADTVIGSPSDDILAAFGGNDSMSGGAGNDFLNGLEGDDIIAGGVGNDSIVSTAGANYLRGDDGNDIIQGGTGFDDINGNMGDDTAAGGLGDDWVVGGKENDRLFGEEGADIVYGNLGDDTCDGGAGDDLLRGGQGNDSVGGGVGNDWVSGDRGDDTLTGGAGADVFHSFGDAGIDRVTDFNRADGDRVQLDPGTVYSVSQVGADTVINMAGGGQMILVGVNIASLTGSWIFGS